MINLKKFLNHTTICLPEKETGELKPYLTRYYLFGKDRKFGNIFIHQFLMSDTEDDLHNHPFKFSLSFILSGGYKEEIFKNNKHFVKKRTPFSFNFINNKTFHKVTLLKKSSWSLFFAGPRSNDWGFMNINDKKFKHWSTSKNAIA